MNPIKISQLAGRTEVGEEWSMVQATLDGSQIILPEGSIVLWEKKASQAMIRLFIRGYIKDPTIWRLRRYFDEAKQWVLQFPPFEEDRLSLEGEDAAAEEELLRILGP